MKRAPLFFSLFLLTACHHHLSQSVDSQVEAAYKVGGEIIPVYVSFSSDSTENRSTRAFFWNLLPFLDEEWREECGEGLVVQRCLSPHLTPRDSLDTSYGILAIAVQLKASCMRELLPPTCTGNNYVSVEGQGKKVKVEVSGSSAIGVKSMHYSIDLGQETPVIAAKRLAREIAHELRSD